MQSLGIDCLQEYVVPEYDSKNALYYQSTVWALENLLDIHEDVSNNEHLKKRVINLSSRRIDALFYDFDKVSGIEVKDCHLLRLKKVNRLLVHWRIINTPGAEKCDIWRVVQLRNT
jgi:hypothetical protein